MSDKPFIIAITGHRERDLTEYQRTLAKTSLLTELSNQKKLHPNLLVYTGMASGIDQYAAQVCIDLGIPYICCVPHIYYFQNYEDARQVNLMYLLKQSQEIVYVVPDETPWHWSHNFKRNEYMLDHADIVLACAKFSENDIPKRGGTAHMMRITKQANKPMVVHVL